MERITVVLRRLTAKGPSHKEGFVQLFISKRLIQGLAGAMLALFTPIFIYQTTGEAFWIVGTMYAVIGILYVVLLVPAMKISNRIGFSRMLAISAFLSALMYGFLYLANKENIWYLLIPIALTVVGFRLFHWVPYHVDFTEFTKGGSRGRDVSLMYATIAFMGIIGPLLAGFIIANAGYSVLFAVGVVLMLFAAISYLFVPSVEEKFTWTYKQTLNHLFSKDFRPVMLGDMANGAESIVTLIAWPIFLFVILNGNVLEIGALSTVIVGVTIVVQLLVGKHLDKAKENSAKTLRTGSILYSIGWVLKIFVISTTQIFFVGLYHNVVKIFTKTPYSTLLYDMSGEQGRYIDEFTLMREMSHHSGRVLALLTMVALTFYFSVEWTFLIAAVASLMLNVVYTATRED